MEKQLIRNKMHQLLDYAKEHDVAEVEKEIHNIFLQNEIVTHRTDIIQAYYDEHIRHVLIKGGNGLEISIIDGDGDRSGNEHAHYGTDIKISSEILGKSDSLFFENNYVTDNRISEIIDETLDFEFSKESVIQYFNTVYADPLMFNILSDDLRNNNDVINATISRINTDAYAKHKEQKKYEDISPYGGLDIIVQKKSEIFLEKMDLFDMPSNEYFMETAKKYFMSDIDNYKFISEEIDRFNQIIYYAEHAEDYRHNESISQEISWLNYELDMLPDKDQLLADLEKIKIDLGINYELRTMDEERRHELNVKLDELNGKKYNFSSYFSQRPHDNKEIINIIKNIEALQNSDYNLLNEFEDKWGYKDLMEMDIKSFEEKEQKLKELEESKINLKYRYEYLLNDLFAEITDDLEQFENSLQRQINAKESIIAKRDIYEDLFKHKDGNINLNIPSIDATKKHGNIIIREYGRDIEYANVLITDKYSVYMNGGDEIRILDNDKQSFLDEKDGYHIYKKIIDDVTTNRIIPSYDRLTSYINLLKENHNSDLELNEEDLEME